MNDDELAQKLIKLQLFVDSLKVDAKRRGPAYTHDDVLAQKLVDLQRLADSINAETERTKGAE